MTNPLRLIYTRGLPGSGKTTWARQFCQANTDFVRINRDDIRAMLGGAYVAGREPLVKRMECSLVYNALMDGYSVVVDATNFKDTERWTGLAQDCGAQLEVKDFTDVPIATCIYRDMYRSESVGADVIQKMYDTFLAVPQ